MSSVVDESLAVKIDIGITLSADIPAKASVVLKDPSGKTVKTTEVTIEKGAGRGSFKAEAGELELWYPVGYGKPALHAVELQVVDEVSEKRCSLILYINP